MTVAVGKAFNRLLDGLSRLSHRCGISNDLVHIMSPGAARGGVEGCLESLNRREGAYKATTPSSTTSQCSSAKRTEAIGSWTRMTMIVHEEGPSVWYKCRVLVPLFAVLFVFTPPSFKGGFLRLP